MKYSVFISYSRDDTSLINPVVKLVRALRKDLVFQDVDSIKAAELWEPQLQKALDDSKIMILFWCKHSAKSTYVKKEYKEAIKNKKSVLPLLLDGTKLPADLKAYQFIDFQDLVRYDHAKVKGRKSISKSLKPFREKLLKGYSTIQNKLFEYQPGGLFDFEITEIYEKRDEAMSAKITEALNKLIPPEPGKTL
ncbi:MAG: toll/interleukin-1 receptor domain-containing protein [Panacibacter sp.]